MFGRFIPSGVGYLTAVIASIVDVNWGALAGGITVIGTAVGATIWQVSSARTKSMKDSKAAELQIYRDSEAAKLEVFKAAEAARIQLAREREAAEAGSLSIQLANLQKSLDDMNGQLAAARELAAAHKQVSESLRLQLEDANRQLAAGNGRVEDANIKLHRLMDEASAKTLSHQVEKMELERKYQAAMRKTDELKAMLATLQATGDVAVVAASAIVPKVVDNTARIDRIEGTNGADPARPPAPLPLS